MTLIFLLETIDASLTELMLLIVSYSDMQQNFVSIFTENNSHYITRRISAHMMRQY